MGTKEKIGSLIILGGVALIGFYWFKKNKPNIASSQAKGLKALSNFYQSGAGGFEDTFIGKSQIKYTNPSEREKCGITQSWYADVCYENLTPKEKEDLKKAIGTIPDPSLIASNQIGQNLQGADFSNLSSLGIAGVTFNIAPKK
jgi:hypothetical protein